ncbi:Panacea domain-containing protein [Virgibacillus sp. W0430]|uniref:Panacea domain-containing protein n=1 Tax=Virgibacillus sp. W0430 TaxID=3391580 RepID=UPI003F482CDF
MRQAERNENGYYSVDDVIDWFLSKGSMSPKKLQKLLYYAYSWTLTLENEDTESLDNKLFDERFEAWVHGPVIPKVYREYSFLGYNNIPRIEGDIPVFQEDIESILNQVWEVYGDYTGDELESITHQESPWLNARSGYKPLDRCNETIKDEDIFECYGARL